MREIHCLDEEGDIWRQLREHEERPQASGIINSTNYEKIVPFRQQEFKNAFLEWVICDGIKQRKACSKRLARCFKIANMQTANAFPRSESTVASWIHELHNWFKPEIIGEIQAAKSYISISFDGWGSKKEKISLLGVVVHFTNSKCEAVTRLIGLPELPDHSKTGFGM